MIPEPPKNANSRGPGAPSHFPAERAGFEPALDFSKHALQACALGRTTLPLPAYYAVDYTIQPPRRQECQLGAFRLGDKPLAHNLKQKQGSPTLYPVDQVELARFADRDRRTCADLLAQLVPNAQRSRQLGTVTLARVSSKYLANVPTTLARVSGIVIRRLLTRFNPIQGTRIPSIPARNVAPSGS
jgi:hypothetical protein